MTSILAAENVTPTGDPVSYQSAMKSSESHLWHTAMKEEFTSLQENSMWELVNLPPGRTTIKNKWVFLTKWDTKGEIIKYKACLVAKGFTQTAGLDYEETFTPVARLDLLRLLLSLAAIFNWNVHHIDIKSASLNGHLDKELYMDQPIGFLSPGETHKVCQLLKAIYGLKQAGHQWHEHLRHSLVDYGYRKLSSGDVSVFIKCHEGGDQTTIVLVYVDDIAIFGSLSDITDTKAFISSRYKSTDLGEIRLFLGLHITHDCSKKTLSIDQWHYIQNITSHFDMLKCRPAYTPFSPGIKLTANCEQSSDSSLTS